MTRKPAPERTRPLDRDGDGADGGSLPGNQTAPMAAAPDPVSQAAITDQIRPVSDDHVHAEPHTEAAQDETGDGPDTFTPEEIAAGATPVVEQEGETTTSAADQATVIDGNDPLVTIDTETAPIAVRLRELETLINARRLYRSPQGYSATYAAPFIDEATVTGWIRAGLAEDIPTAGNSGGVKLTAKARQVVTRLRHQLAEAA